MTKGQVWEVNAGFYEVLDQKGQTHVLRAAGKLRKDKMPPLVGDFVEFQKGGFVESVLPRKNFFERPKVANIDQALILSSLKNPPFSSFLLVKMLATFETKGVEPVIVFTKTDLCLDWKTYCEEYESHGYRVFAVNNKSKAGIQKLKSVFCKSKLTVFVGQTGVGKTSTINNLTNLNLQTQEISRSLNRGKHTTRVVKIFRTNNLFLVDCPGFSSVELNMSALVLAKSFRIFKGFLQNCQFAKTCLHQKERNCGVKNAVQENLISRGFYNNYLRLLKEIQN